MKWIFLFLLFGFAANAQLAVTVSQPKITGQKAVVSLAMRNNFAEKIESARAALFLFDEHGKIVGQATKWVIGGSNTRGLAAGATNSFHCVITSDNSLPTNLTAKVTFNRVVLERGKLADISKDVTISIGRP